MAKSSGIGSLGLTFVFVFVGCGSGSSSSKSSLRDGSTSAEPAADALVSSGDNDSYHDVVGRFDSPNGDAQEDVWANDRPADVAGDVPDASFAEGGSTHLDASPPDVSDGLTVADRPADGKENGQDAILAQDRNEPIDIASSDVYATPDSGASATDVQAAELHWVSLQAPLGTPIAAIAIDSDGVLLAGSDNPSSTDPSSGIFASPDEGGSWRPINTGVHDFHVASLFADGTTLYAGTASLLRSVDHGASWIEVVPPVSVGHMSIIGAQGDLAMVASDYGGNAFALSTDGGQTFKSLSYGGDANDIVVLGSVILRASSQGVLRSTDRGATFLPVQGINNGMDYDANMKCDGVQTCYASAHNATELDPPMIMKSTDAGATWVSTGKQSSKVLALSDSGSVYVSTSPTMARSDDGGATWNLVQRPTTIDAFEPNCDGPFVARGVKIFAACSDGVYRSTDQGGHWSATSGSPATGAITGTVRMLLVDTTATSLGTNGDLFLAANSSTLQRSIDDGQTWQVVSDPFPGRPCIVTGNGALECVGSTASFGGSGLMRSEDHGATWKDVPNLKVSVKVIANLGSVVYAGSSGVMRSDDDGLTYQLLSGSPTVSSLQVLKSGHILAGASLNQVYRSTDRGVTWKTLSRAFPLPVLDDGKGRLLLAAADGNVSVSTDEGDTWHSIVNSGLPYASMYVGPLGMDGAGRLFINDIGPAPSPYASRGELLYISTDDGATWSLCPVQTPNPNVSVFVTDKKGRLLAATSGGVYRLE